MKFDSLRAINKFKQFVARARDHEIKIKFCEIKSHWVVTLSCEYQGKFKQGYAMGMVLFGELADKGEVNKSLYEAFDNINNTLDGFDEPKKEDCFV